jgi:hypothetical protein
MRLRRWPGWGLVLLAAVGCSTGGPTRNSLSGQVLLDGRPVTDGVVTLHGPGGAEATSSIRADGSYVVDDPPLGVCQITVRAEPAGVSVEPAAHGEEARRATAASGIPKRYERPGNGLEVDVKPGRQTHTIALTG